MQSSPLCGDSWLEPLDPPTVALTEGQVFVVELALLVCEEHESRVLARRMILERNTEEVMIARSGSEYLARRPRVSFEQ